jgi:Putative tail fiber protein gp53-like, C-terminal
MSTKLTSVELSGGSTVDMSLPTTDNSTAIPNTSWVQALLAVFGIATSLAANGYLKIAGVIIQWGNANAAASSVNVTFPITFPSALWTIQAMPCNYGPNAGRASPYMTSVSTSGAVITSAGSSGNYLWLAIGH